MGFACRMVRLFDVSRLDSSSVNAWGTFNGPCWIQLMLSTVAYLQSSLCVQPPYVLPSNYGSTVFESLGPLFVIAKGSSATTFKVM